MTERLRELDKGKETPWLKKKDVKKGKIGDKKSWNSLEEREKEISFVWKWQLRKNLTREFPGHQATKFLLTVDFNTQNRMYEPIVCVLYFLRLRCGRNSKIKF